MCLLWARPSAGQRDPKLKETCTWPQEADSLVENICCAVVSVPLVQEEEGGVSSVAACVVGVARPLVGV